MIVRKPPLITTTESRSKNAFKSTPSAYAAVRSKAAVLLLLIHFLLLPLSVGVLFLI